MGLKYEDVAEQVLDMAKRQGRVQAEVFLLDSQELTIEVAQMNMENLKLAHERGVGLRVISDGRPGYAYSSDLSYPALQVLVKKALGNARQAEADPGWELPGPAGSYNFMELYDEETFLVPVEEKIKLAQSMEEAARSYDRRIKVTEKAVYHDAKYRVTIYNSMGLAGNYQGSYCGGYIVVVGQENGDSETGFGLHYSVKYRGIDPQKIGREAGEKAVRMLGAKPIPSGQMPVVLEPYTATNFLGILQAAFSAEAVLKEKSFLKGEEGKQVASSLVTIIDDGTLHERLGSSPFDGEGVPTSRTVLVEEGKLIGYLHNAYTAGKFGVSSTGNCVRSTYKSTPEVGTTNFFIKEGKACRNELVEELPYGLYITDVLGMHTANPVSGDFSIGASGLLIENGEFTRPFKGIAVAGNLKELLADIDAVADDLTFFMGKGAPTLRIKALSISGK